MSRVKCQILPSFNGQTVEIRIKLLGGSTLMTYAPIKKLRFLDGGVLPSSTPYDIVGSVECEVTGLVSGNVVIKYVGHTLLVDYDSIIEELACSPGREYFKIKGTLEGLAKAYLGEFDSKQAFAKKQVKVIIDPKFINWGVYTESLFASDYWAVKSKKGIYVFKGE